MFCVPLCLGPFLVCVHESLKKPTTTKPGRKKKVTKNTQKMSDTCCKAFFFLTGFLES